MKTKYYFMWMQPVVQYILLFTVCKIFYVVESDVVVIRPLFIFSIKA